MAYEPNIALARKISKALREAGLDVKRALSASTITVRDPEDLRVAIVIESMQKSDAGFDVSMWRAPNSTGNKSAAQRVLLRAVASLLRDAGLSVDMSTS